MPFAHMGGPGFFWPIIPLLWMLFWGALIFLFVRARRRGWNPWGDTRPTSPIANAETILAERFARGEMTDDEYYQRLSVLKEGRS
ncbi:hypothetical protein AB0K60_04475 [Thermopolyspora sp. NPDC052614]|uniref:SHOCT domain-containing protein n=1 Tax=Thermopolyspora sp. NPDC052614 TaxID=3155682 RepID=UPI0034466E5C